MAVRESASSFSTLPRAFYLDDPALLEAEIDRIWSREWLYVAHESEIPASGDFVVRTIIGESVIVVRNADGGVSAVLNVCRHRGARIVDAPSGSAKRFTCPYHQWTYDLDGTLRGAPSMPNSESVNYGELGLYRVQVEVWRGLVFVCLGDEAPPSIGDEIESLSPGLAAYRPERLRKVAMKTYACAANWKVMLENYLECYHCSGSHPEFCVTADLRIRSDSEYVEEAYRESPYWGLDIPLRRDTKTASMSGDYVSSPLLVSAESDTASGHSRGFVIQPAFTVLYFYADYAMVHEIRPVSPTETHFHLHWFVSEDADDAELDIDTLTHVWDMTTRQDVELIERTQDGLKSRRYAPGPLSARQEPGIRAALSTYLGIMSGNAVVERMLADAA
jgi:phenylpropionate dioxygenase-like ring-hydroxylating dioxygenase large terminal subunit